MTVGSTNILSHRVAMVSIMGFLQILAYGSTYFLLAVLAIPIQEDTGWSLSLIVGGVSWALLISGLVVPKVGKSIDRYEAKYVLALGSLMMGLGLLLLGFAKEIIFYYIAWTCIGLGMAAGLYEAAFALLARYYAVNARSAISGVALIGGFASSVAWPLVTIFEHSYDWRLCCFILAALHLMLGLPLYLSMPKHALKADPNKKIDRGETDVTLKTLYDFRFILLIFAFTFYAFNASALSVHILTLLKGIGLDPFSVVFIGSLIGPAKVAGRFIELLLGRFGHPLLSARVGIVLSMVGTALIAFVGGGSALIAMLLYGIGNGMLTIARGTIPLALFGSDQYGIRIGLLSRPMMIVQALAPIVTAYGIDYMGGNWVLILNTIILMIATILFFILRR